MGLLRYKTKKTKALPLFILYLSLIYLYGRP